MKRLFCLFLGVLIYTQLPAQSFSMYTFPFHCSFFECVAGSRVKTITERYYPNDTENDCPHTEQWTFNCWGNLIFNQYQSKEYSEHTLYTYGDDGHKLVSIKSEARPYSVINDNYSPTTIRFYNAQRQFAGESNYTYGGEFAYLLEEKGGPAYSCYDIRKYYYKDLILYSIITETIGETSVIKCNSNGLPVSEYVYDNSENKLTLIRRIYFEYKLDKNGNWIRKVAKRDGKIISTTTREITYHNKVQYLI